MGEYKKLGFILGGFVGIDLSEKISTQFEIYFINKECKNCLEN